MKTIAYIPNLLNLYTPSESKDLLRICQGKTWETHTLAKEEPCPSPFDIPHDKKYISDIENLIPLKSYFLLQYYFDPTTKEKCLATIFRIIYDPLRTWVTYTSTDHEAIQEIESTCTITGVSLKTTYQPKILLTQEFVLDNILWRIQIKPRVRTLLWQLTIVNTGQPYIHVDLLLNSLYPTFLWSTAFSLLQLATKLRLHKNTVPFIKFTLPNHLDHPHFNLSQFPLRQYSSFRKTPASLFGNLKALLADYEKDWDLELRQYEYEQFKAYIRWMILSKDYQPSYNAIESIYSTPIDSIYRTAALKIYLNPPTSKAHVHL